jgi:hypothetical protein
VTDDIERLLELKVSYKGTGKQKTIHLSDITDIDEESLTEHFAEQATIFGYFAVQLAEADKLLSASKTQVEQAYAEADAFYRESYNSLEQKYTEAVIRGDVLLDEDYNEALDNQRDAQYNVAILKSIVNALRMKADMLISMGAHMRQEYGMTGMNIRQQNMEKSVDDAKAELRKKRKQKQV